MIISFEKLFLPPCDGASRIRLTHPSNAAFADVFPFDKSAGFGELRGTRRADRMQGNLRSAHDVLRASQARTCRTPDTSGVRRRRVRSSHRIIDRQSDMSRCPTVRRKRTAPAATPAFTAPCLARSGSPPEGEEWLHEIKLDGYRVQCLIADDGSVRILTRSGLDWTPRFQPLARALELSRLGSAALDGEAVVFNSDGLTEFGALQRSLKAGGEDIVLMAFDLLSCAGRDLRNLPLIERKDRLRDLLGDRGLSCSRIRYVDHLFGSGETALTEACRLGLEGIVSKRTERPYCSGRLGDWIKSKCIATDELVVAGFVPERNVSHRIGSLVLAYYADGHLVHAGRVGTGFSASEARDLYAALEATRTDRPAISENLSRSEARGVVWVTPRLVVQVAYRELTGDGLLRQARFIALREDKPAGEVGRPAGVVTVG
ncbi:MAG: non-homologous end-joining DNA ligase [Hyphomicrobiaceae bacterium]